jgi:CelD/BcsL family acetyltransferase involved in cellulose biosynthesis
MIEALAERSADQADIVGPEISITLACSFQELAAIRDEWDRFAEDSGSDIYFTMDWLQVWWSHYGARRELRGFVIRDGRKIVAALPFCITKLRLGPLNVKLARWIGADSTISVLRPAVAHGYEVAAFEVVCRRLLVDEQCDAISLSPLSGLSAVGNAVRTLCGDVGAYYLARDDSPGPHIVVELPDTFEEYLSMLAKPARSYIRRKNRQLSERYEVKHQVVAGGDLDACFDSFVALHEVQWRAAGRLGHFGDWPASDAFNRELVARLASKGRVRFYQLCADDEIISMEYGFVLGDRYYGRLPARRTDAVSDKFALGHVGYVKMLESLIDEGVHMVEDGPGHYAHKLRYGERNIRCGVK